MLASQIADLTLLRRGRVARRLLAAVLWVEMRSGTRAVAISRDRFCVDVIDVRAVRWVEVAERDSELDARAVVVCGAGHRAPDRSGRGVGKRCYIDGAQRIVGCDGCIWHGPDKAKGAEGKKTAGEHCCGMCLDLDFCGARLGEENVWRSEASASARFEPFTPREQRDTRSTHKGKESPTLVDASEMKQALAMTRTWK